MADRKLYIKNWRLKNKEKLAQRRKELAKLPAYKERLRNNVRRWRKKPGVKEVENHKQVLYRMKIKAAVFGKYGDICNCCGESEPLFLSIDHVQNDGFKEKLPNGKRPGGRMLYHKIISENFPEKYQILCMNCNFGKSKNKGVCPHKLLT